jgi:hypothetical protein
VVAPKAAGQLHSVLLQIKPNLGNAGSGVAYRSGSRLSDQESDTILGFSLQPSQKAEAYDHFSKNR